MSPAAGGLTQSIHTRLLNHARASGADPNSVLARYGLERFLYRLGRSPHADRFVLKGGMLLRVWLGETSRPTRDADFLGYGDLSTAELQRIFREVCGVSVEPDGVTYTPESVDVAPIRVEDAYGGQRITSDRQKADGYAIALTAPPLPMPTSACTLRGLLGKAQLTGWSFSIAATVFVCSSSAILTRYDPYSPSARGSGRRGRCTGDPVGRVGRPAPWRGAIWAIPNVNDHMPAYQPAP